MKTPFGNLPFVALAFTLAALAVPVLAGAQKAARFPDSKGENLEKKSYQLPRDLKGDLNIVVLAFEREQQEAVNTWIPAAQELCAASPSLRYYEIPVIQKTTRQAENFLNQAMVDGIPAQSDRERTITLYTDKKRFKKALAITDESVIPILLLDRQGRIVWRGSGTQTPEKAAELTKAAQDWLSANAPRIETFSGPPASLADYRGRPVFLVLSGQGPAKASALLMQEILIGCASKGDFVYAAAADLTGAPGILRGMIRDGIKDDAKKNNVRLVAALKQAGIPYDSRFDPVLLLDWQGILARQFAVAGKTQKAYQAFVLDRDGKTVFQCEQPGGKDAPSPAPQIIRALQNAAATKKVKAP